MTKFSKNLKNVTAAFDRDALARVCIMPESEFGAAYGMRKFYVDQKAPDNFYFFRDSGSRVLAVAHLDTVAYEEERAAHFLDTEAGPVVYSRALDDRLGAYIILHLLPELGIEYDVLLTVGEESGCSTATFFETTQQYDWIIEFDRGGTDVVMYQYDDDDTRAAVRACHAQVGDGIFSDISYMEHLGVKGFNWGVGYRDYHGPRAHAYLDDTYAMVARYLKFHQQNQGVAMPHEVESDPWFKSSRYGRYVWDDGDGADDKFDDEGMYDSEYREPEYFDREYIDDPTIEEIQAALEAMDEESVRETA